MIKLLKESYGDLSDYLERHLDSWYGRLNEIGDDIENLGLDVDEINNEYVIVHAAEPDGEDVYCKIWLGGTPRTISLETFEMLESIRRFKNAIKEKNEGCYNMKSRKDTKNTKPMKESYSDIDVTNVWDAYYIAKDYLGADTLCDNLAQSMDSLILSVQLQDIFRLFEIPFMDDDEFEEEDYGLDIDEGCHGRKTKKKSRKLKEDSSERYGRYLVKISIYKNMNKLDYIDEHWDKSDYCFFDENGYLDTDYSGISRDLFNKIYDPSMKPGHVYEVYTDGPYGDIIEFEEVPYGWFRY